MMTTVMLHSMMILYLIIKTIKLQDRIEKLERTEE